MEKHYKIIVGAFKDASQGECMPYDVFNLAATLLLCIYPYALTLEKAFEGPSKY